MARTDRFERIAEGMGEGFTARKARSWELPEGVSLCLNECILWPVCTAAGFAAKKARVNRHAPVGWQAGGRAGGRVGWRLVASPVCRRAASVASARVRPECVPRPPPHPTHPLPRPQVKSQLRQLGLLPGARRKK